MFFIKWNNNIKSFSVYNSNTKQRLHDDVQHITTDLVKLLFRDVV